MEKLTIFFFFCRNFTEMFASHCRSSSAHLPENHKLIWLPLEKPTDFLVRNSTTCLSDTGEDKQPICQKRTNIFQSMGTFTYLISRNSQKYLTATVEVHRFVGQKLTDTFASHLRRTPPVRNSPSYCQPLEKFTDFLSEDRWYIFQPLVNLTNLFAWGIPIYLQGTYRYNCQKLEKFTSLISKSSLCNNYHIRLTSRLFPISFSMNLDNL